MFVHVTEAAVTMVLRGGNKNRQDVNQDLTTTTPRLAELLRLWRHHAASAQPDNAHPFVIFKTENKSYGTSYDNSGAHGKLVARAWKVARCNPQDDADKEWANNDKPQWGTHMGLGNAQQGEVRWMREEGIPCYAYTVDEYAELVELAQARRPVPESRLQGHSSSSSQAGVVSAQGL